MEPIDTRLLSAAIEFVEQRLSDAQRVLSPSRKAELVSVAYSLFLEARHDDAREQIARAVACIEQAPSSPQPAVATTRAATPTALPSRPGTFPWNPSPNREELI